MEKRDEKTGDLEEEEGNVGERKKSERQSTCPEGGSEKGRGWQALLKSVNAVPEGEKTERKTELYYRDLTIEIEQM